MALKPPPPPEYGIPKGFIIAAVLAGAIGIGLWVASSLPDDEKAAHPGTAAEIAKTTTAASPPVVDSPPPETEVHYLVSDKKGGIIIWRDEDAMVRGFKLAAASTGLEYLDLVKPLVECVVASGAKVILDDPGDASSRVLVLSGKARGCEGYLPNYYIAPSPH